VTPLLTRRWIGLHVLAILLIGVFGLLGRWQLHRALGSWDSHGPVTNGPPVPLLKVSEISRPVTDRDVGRPVTLSGHYDLTRQRLIAGRRSGSEIGLWVLTPLQLADSSVIPVVRGWVPEGRSLTGDLTEKTTENPSITVVGYLQPSEGFERATIRTDGKLSAINTAQLVALFPQRLRDGYVVARTESLSNAALSPTMRRIPVTEIDVTQRPFPLRNSAYAVQWWIFGILVAVIWCRMVHDERRADG
jgi:cytochrome oxidase assembly protein ShyY1